ncbi:signal peptidase II [Rhodohalobacter sp.]|uniref:signal peptidase II n=1 Tax=Rhodohalobacter sp. TaxID=1974210 RepID=UPI002ACDDFCA|nr:signal peptidase II [Rhodohalobacter sp.]MDZ7755120.1 signal peptidase II [Rhodohalobacter sp.]
MSEKAKKLLIFSIPAVFVLIIDQITKHIVRTSPELHRLDLIEGWLAFNFTKNPGMAMGMDWLSTPAISVIAISATIGIVGYIVYTLNRANYAYLVCMGLIIGGALGNIYDRIFMGIVGGYGGVLDGHVVDFIHFYLQIGDTAVFPYIFNVADIAITTSIIILLLFHKWILPEEENEENDLKTEIELNETVEGASKIESTDQQ